MVRARDAPLAPRGLGDDLAPLRAPSCLRPYHRQDLLCLPHRRAAGGGALRNPKPWITALYSRGPEPMREISRNMPLEGEGGGLAESLFQKVPGQGAHPSGLN